MPNSAPAGDVIRIGPYSKSERPFETVIVGAGAAGTGPLVWAAGNGVLDDWLARGVAIVDRREAMGGTVGRYALNADTLGGTFLECLDGPAPHPCLVRLRDDAVARALDGYRDASPPLALVGEFLARLGGALASEIARRATSRFLPGRRVLALRLCADGSVTAEMAGPHGGREAVRARSAVLALGGRQPMHRRGELLLPGIGLDAWRHKLMPSDRLLAQGGAALASERLRGLGRAARVVILGGSHSAFSAAWVLLELASGIRFGHAGITILCRNEPRVFYPSRAAAATDGYRFGEQDVCPATGRVNRLGGLRGDGRELWRRMQGLASPREARIALRCFAGLSAAALRATFDAADLIVPALGYRLATVPIYAADGARIALASAGPVVDNEARLRTFGGEALPNVFGVGLGSGFRPWGDMAGEPAFHGQQNSLWLYQHGLGALIHDRVRRWAAYQEAPREKAEVLRAIRDALSFRAGSSETVAYPTPQPAK